MFLLHVVALMAVTVTDDANQLGNNLKVAGSFDPSKIQEVYSACLLG